MNPAYSSSKRPSTARVVSVFAAIVVGLALLGLAFAWATDPRPVEGSHACATYKAGPILPWSREKDGPMGCKPRFWSMK